MSTSPVEPERRSVDRRARRADATWTRHVEEYVRTNAHRFPRLEDFPARRLRATIRAETDRLNRIAGALHAAYGSPDLGNKADPVDEIVYIALSRRTRESAYQAAYDALRVRWSSWEEVADASESDIAETISPSGLGTRKARSIREALRIIRERFGRCALPVSGWSDDAVREFLTSLPEVGEKSAACVMAMALGRATFAVDAHVGRVMSRLAPYGRLGLDLEHLDHRRRQAVLPDLVPRELRRDLHVNLVVHGRQVCRLRPCCAGCVVQALCPVGIDRTRR